VFGSKLELICVYGPPGLEPRYTVYPTTFWEVLASHERLTVCAAARAGKVKRVKRASTRTTAFDCCVRFLTGLPLLPVLAHGGGLKSRCTAILTERVSLTVKQRKLQLPHSLLHTRIQIGPESTCGLCPNWRAHCSATDLSFLDDGNCRLSPRYQDQILLRPGGADLFRVVVSASITQG